MGATRRHPRATFTVDGLKIGRRARRNERAGTIRDGQFFEESLRRQVSLFEKCHMLLQRHRQEVTGALRQSLRVKTLHGFSGVFDEWTARRKKHSRHNAADDRAMESFVIREIFQHRKRATPGLRQLHRPGPEAALQFVKVRIKPGARIADDDDRARLEPSACLCPEVFRVVQRWPISDRAAADLPCDRAEQSDDHDQDRDAAPGLRRDRPLKIGSR